jgi:hypothetical protein
MFNVQCPLLVLISTIHFTASRASGCYKFGGTGDCTAGDNLQQVCGTKVAEKY